MTNRPFPTCHCHPSSLDSASTPEAFAEKEVQLGSGYITVTDHGSLGACRRVYDVAKKKGLVPVLGLEGYFRDDKDPYVLSKGVVPDAKGTLASYIKYHHLTMHFLDQQAYECGIRLLSKADKRSERHGSERKPLFDWAALEELGVQNVTMTSSCLIGMVQRHLVEKNDPEGAIHYYQRLRGLCRPGNFYVELFPHVCDRYWQSAVLLQLEGETEPQRLRPWKKLRTDREEITARELAERGLHGPTVLLARMDDRHWVDVTPRQILGIRLLEDFVPNECRAWCPDGDVQLGANRFVYLLAQRFGDPLLIGDDSHFVAPEDKVVQDVKLMAGGNTWRFYGSYHRQSGDEARHYFLNRMGMSERGYEALLDSAYGWAQRFKAFRWESSTSLPASFYPQDTLRHTMSLIAEHGRMRWDEPAYVQRLGAEIKLLHQNGVIDLLPYFFIDEEVCRMYAENEHLTGPGRGSAAGLLLCHLLGITHLDPLRWKLSLERFLTLDRIKSGKHPDIDQDLDDRDLLLDEENGWLWKRFGRQHAVQIGCYTTLKLKNSTLDVARVLLGSVPPGIQALTKRMEKAPQGVEDRKFVLGGTDDDGHQIQGSLERDRALQEYVRTYPEHWKIVQRCLGVDRQMTRHPCGYIISDRPVEEWIPLTTVSDIPVTQYAAPSIEAVGGLKMDFLGLNSLADIRLAIGLIQRRSGTEFPDKFVRLEGERIPRCRLVPWRGQVYDVWKLPPCPEVFEDIANGRTETVFQYNTAGALKWLEHFNHPKTSGTPIIDSIEAMAVFTALDRPGPLDIVMRAPDGTTHNALIEYAHRARGLPRADSLPFFDQILPETYGLMCYQEQLQRVYQYLTDCSLADAEEFRGYVAKKKDDKLKACFPHYLEQASKKVGEEVARQAWDAMKTWAQYGFNLSHATCYAIIGYVCAFLKHFFPLEWWTAVLTNGSKQEINDKFWTYCGDLLLLPDIKMSGDGFTIEGDHIRAPLSLLKGVGDTAHAELCSMRPVNSLTEFCEKMQATKKAKTKVDEAGKTKNGQSALKRPVVYTLIVAGALDSLFEPEEDGLPPPLMEQLRRYEAALATASGKRAMPVDPAFNLVSPLKRYQMRKEVLPAYGEDLREVVSSTLPMERGNRFWVLRRPNEAEDLPILSCQDLDLVMEAEVLAQKVEVGVVAYIEGTRRFTYGQERREAVALKFEVGGGKYEAVRWPGKSGRAESALDVLKGAIVLLTLSRRDQSKVCIEGYHILQMALKSDQPGSA